MSTVGRMVLERKVCSPMDLGRWTKSTGYADIIEFVEHVNHTVRSKSINEHQRVSNNISKVVALISKLDEHIEQFPLEETQQRFGNKAFRTWYSWLNTHIQSLCVDTFVDEPIEDKHLLEVVGYLLESVGNSTRIDYGTGHELAFVACLLSLAKTGFIKKNNSRCPSGGALSSSTIDDFTAVGLAVMPAYLKFVRHLQTYFRMEPAGSHGVWSLDDFQFIPYIWGSSQLIGSGLYEPKVIPNREIASKERDSNLLFSCIDYIFQVKTGPFAEHSSTLQGISRLPHWEKVNSGMIKMFKGEVLEKFPIIQHFLFGDLIKIDPAPPKARNSPGFRHPSSQDGFSGLFKKPIGTIPHSGDLSTTEKKE